MSAHGAVSRDLQVVDIVRKELDPGESGKTEREVLNLLSKLKHINIVEFLGSYEYDGSWNFLFPYYQMNLKQFLDRPLELQPHVIYSGMFGVADALTNIHTFTVAEAGIMISQIGYHHDLSPANILVDGNRFVITDFGLSKLKPDDQNSRSTLRGGNEDYLGPEAYDYAKARNLETGRSLDIWALGCLLSEVSTLIEGHQVADFYSERKATHQAARPITDHAFHLDGDIRPSVNDWLIRLERQAKDSETPMLISLIRKMLNGNSFTRIKAKAVADALALMTVRSKYIDVDECFCHKIHHPQEANVSNDVFYLLERSRLEAWWFVFESLPSDQRLKSIKDLLAILDLLKSTMKMSGDAFLTQDLLLHEEGPREVWNLVDSLCKIFPDEIRQRVQDRWSHQVCCIQDVDVLNAIRKVRVHGRYRTVGAKAAMKYMAGSISQSIRVGARSRYLDAACVDYNDVPPPISCNGITVIPDHSRTMGIYETEHGKNLRVLIEWKTYDADWAKAAVGDELHRRMDALVNLLDPNETPRVGEQAQRVLDCIGYFHESSRFRFGFLYDLKTDSSSIVHLYSANTYLRVTDHELDQNEIERPCLGCQFMLAKGLAHCIWSFHEAGWVHKNITSHQILFFAESEKQIHQSFGSGILAGFIESRQAASGITLGPRDEYLRWYRHPQYSVDVPFRATFDYYSFGIVLLELGCWCTISSIKEAHNDINDAEEFRLILLELYVPQLRENRGSFYEDAVRFCLDAENATEMSAAGDVERELFKVQVFERLARCCA